MATKTLAVVKLPPLDDSSGARQNINTMNSTEKTSANVGASKERIDLNKVLKLMTDPHSIHLQERHEHSLMTVVKDYFYGFRLVDLVTLSKIINLLADRLENEAFFLAAILDLLDICKTPFLKSKSSDELAYGTVATEAIAQIGFLMRVPVSSVRAAVCDVIHALYSAEVKVQPIDNELQPCSLEFRRSCIEHSHVAQTLAKSLALVDDDYCVRLAITDLLRLLCRHSVSACQDAVLAGIAPRLCSQLADDSDRQGLLLSASMELLMRIIMENKSSGLESQLTSNICVKKLMEAFLGQLQMSPDQKRRLFRNDLLVLIGLLAKSCPKAPFLETGLVQHLTLLATCQEVRRQSGLTRNIRLANHAEDFEFKKILYTVLLTMTQDAAVLQVLDEGRLFPALFTHLSPTRLQNKTWSPQQSEELELLSLTLIGALGGRMPHTFLAAQGGTRLLLMLEWCVGTDKDNKKNNSIQAGNCPESRAAQFAACVRAVREIASSGQMNLLVDLINQGAIYQILEILDVFSQDKGKLEDSIQLRIQTDLIISLSYLIDCGSQTKDSLVPLGVNILIQYLKMDLTLLTSGLGHNDLMLAVVDCIWTCLVGCFATEDDFLEKEGAFLLLDVLEVSPPSMRGCLLSCILDLSENLKILLHLTTWRGKAGQTVARLMCDIWRQEEKRQRLAYRNFATDSLCLYWAGQTPSYDEGEMSKVKNRYRGGSKGSHASSRCNSQVESRTSPVTDVRTSRVSGQSNARKSCATSSYHSDVLDSPMANTTSYSAKTTGVSDDNQTDVRASHLSGQSNARTSRAMSFHHSDVLDSPVVITAPYLAKNAKVMDDKMDLTGKIYGILSKLGFVDLPGLTAQDHITLAAIEYYLDLKTGDVWRSLNSELEREGVRPTSPDREALDVITKMADERVENVQQIQRELQQAEHQQEEEQEKLLYAELKECQSQREKQTIRWQELVARTSKYPQLKAAKLAQEQSIEASRLQTDYRNSPRFHNTDLPSLHVTTFANRFVVVQNPMMAAQDT